MAEPSNAFIPGFEHDLFVSYAWADDRVPGSAAADTADDLAALRRSMVERSRAAVFNAGTTARFRGAKPGIRDELDRFRARHPGEPVYLLGAARRVAEAEAEAAGADWERNGLARGACAAAPGR